MSAAAAPLPAAGSLGAWVLAVRPATLAVGATPVLVGSAVAHASGSFRAGPALAALAGALLLQVGSNLANDVFDFEKGADTKERLGPPRAAQMGLLTPRQLYRGMVSVFALATVAGAYLTIVAGPTIVLLGVASIAAAIAYTGGPYPLGYHGLGDLFVFVFFGLVAVCGTVFVQTGGVPLTAVLAAIPVGAIASCVLVVNNVRDQATDTLAGKRTLAVRFGRRFGLSQYKGLLAAAYLVPVAFASLGLASPWVLLPWLTLPLAVRLARDVDRSSGAAMNPHLGGTARLLFSFGALFAAGLVASA